MSIICWRKSWDFGQQRKSLDSEKQESRTFSRNLEEAKWFLWTFDGFIILKCKYREVITLVLIKLAKRDIEWSRLAEVKTTLMQESPVTWSKQSWMLLMRHIQIFKLYVWDI